MRKPHLILWSVVVLLALAGVGYLLYERVSWVELDLSLIESYAATESYSELIRRVHEREDPSDGFTFVVLGDTRSNLAMAREVLQEAVKENPAFILSNGDIVRKGRPEEYVAHHLQLVKEIAPHPFIPVPGNHEEGPNRDFAAFRAVYGEERFNFDFGECRFVGINNGDHTGLSGSDLRYLEQELSRPASEGQTDPPKYKFVIFHVPPIFLANAVAGEDGRGFRWNARKLKVLMTRLGVDHVFVGHVHGFASEVVDGVRYTITGGGGADLTSELGPEGNVHNYVVVHVGPQGLRTEVVRLMKGQWTRAELKEEAG